MGLDTHEGHPYVTLIFHQNKNAPIARRENVQKIYLRPNNILWFVKSIVNVLRLRSKYFVPINSSPSSEIIASTSIWLRSKSTTKNLQIQIWTTKLCPVATSTSVSPIISSSNSLARLAGSDKYPSNPVSIRAGTFDDLLLSPPEIYNSSVGCRGSIIDRLWSGVFWDIWR